MLLRQKKYQGIDLVAGQHYFVGILVADAYDEIYDSALAIGLDGTGVGVQDLWDPAITPTPRMSPQDYRFDLVGANQPQRSALPRAGTTAHEELFAEFGTGGLERNPLERAWGKEFEVPTAMTPQAAAGPWSAATSGQPPVELELPLLTGGANPGEKRSAIRSREDVEFWEELSAPLPTDRFHLLERIFAEMGGGVARS